MGQRQTPHITFEAVQDFWKERLPSPQRQADDAVLFVGERQPSPEVALPMSAYHLGAWIGSSLENSGFPHLGLNWILAHLAKTGLLEGIPPLNRVGLEDAQIGLRLTMAGWEKYAELKRKQNASFTAFMAMKFDDPELDHVVEKFFKPAVLKTGFELKKVTDGQPTGIIDDQMRAAILASRFVVADLTHGSHGAYWEAGFAEGLELPVVYTCKKSEWNKQTVHFDTNHLVTIVWDPDKLPEAAQKLTATIRATLRSEAIQQDG